MNMQQIGYFLFMEEAERQQEKYKVNVELNDHLVGFWCSTSEEDDGEQKKSYNITPGR